MENKKNTLPIQNRKIPPRKIPKKRANILPTSRPPFFRNNFQNKANPQVENTEKKIDLNGATHALLLAAGLAILQILIMFIFYLRPSTSVILAIILFIIYLIIVFTFFLDIKKILGIKKGTKKV